MNSLMIGDIVKNSIQQRSIVRWKGFIEEIPVIGLQSIDLRLPGYTNGTCLLDDNRYFQCPDGYGYYIFETSFTSSHTIIEKNKETEQLTTSNGESHSEKLSPKPIPSACSPSVSQNHSNSTDNHDVSPSCGILSRLTSKQQQKKSPSPPSATTTTENDPLDQTSSRIYHPNNYRSVSCDQISDQNSPLYNQTLSTTDVPSFSREYYLDDWILSRLKTLMEKNIPQDNCLCLNIYEDHCHVQNLINEQINGCISIRPQTVLDDIQIELIKLYNNVEVIFPSPAVRLYEDDYLLLAILCSNNECAYIRTSKGWAYTDGESENNPSIIVDEISQLIDYSVSNLLNHSEQCRHLLQNASFLYYKRVQVTFP